MRNISGGVIMNNGSVTAVTSGLLIFIAASGMIPTAMAQESHQAVSVQVTILPFNLANGVTVGEGTYPTAIAQ
jgi:flagellar motor component MotA